VATYFAGLLGELIVALGADLPHGGIHHAESNYRLEGF